MIAILIMSASRIASGQTAPDTGNDPIKTDKGLVSGSTIGEPGKQVRIYKAIPYAAPPVGNLRWKAPQPVTPWQGVKEAKTFSPWCTQLFPTMKWMGSIPESQMSEDCLYLNVLTPAHSANEKLPVMVWIHPGGLDAGSGNMPLFNMPALPQHGVVLVTVVSRLGGMGYLVHPGMMEESPQHAAGNFGNLDLIAALQWVKTNIAAFGGDPNCVTIFGQSGGAGKIVWLLASPLAKGLFHRGIIEAGASATGDTLTGTMVGIVRKQETSAKVGDKFARTLGATTLAEFRAVPWQQIVKALPAPQVTNEFNVYTTVDGWSMPDTPFNMIMQGKGNDVPVMIGGGENEREVRRAATLFTPGFLKNKSNTYAYIFSHAPANWKRSGMLAYHGEELPYEFGDLPFIYGDWGTNLTTMYPKDPGLTKDDDVVSENYIRMWVQFAKTGDPSVPGLIKAEPLRTGSGGDRYLDIGLHPHVKSGYFLGEPTIKTQVIE
jgi:para-nitrobenzyl esterase